MNWHVKSLQLQNKGRIMGIGENQYYQTRDRKSEDYVDRKFRTKMKREKKPLITHDSDNDTFDLKGQRSCSKLFHS